MPEAADARALILRLLFRRISSEDARPTRRPADPPPGPVRRASEADKEAGATCRICFEGGEGLVAPCACAGSQEWIHESCLRTWQRSLVGQGGERASRCNVCTQVFSLPPLPLPTAPVQAGSLLVAAPQLGGTFKQSVVLICHFEEHGE